MENKRTLPKDWAKKLLYKMKSFICKIKYKDYKDNQYNHLDETFLFGVKDNYIDKSGKEQASFYTNNILELTYNRKTKKYNLLLFLTGPDDTDRTGQVIVLRNCLALLTNWMRKNGYATNIAYPVWLEEIDPRFNNVDDIRDLYYHFKLFVNGFEKIEDYI